MTNDPARAVTLVRSPVAELHSRFGGRTKAIVVGIDAYTHGIRPLTTARADAEAVARVLRERHGYDDVRLLVDAQATQAGLRGLLAALPASVEPGDRLLFYFAGHGVADPAEDGDNRPEFYLIPSDASREDLGTFLPMGEVLEALAGRGCQHLLVVLDCCFAGAMRWSVTRSAGAPAGRRKALYWERFQRYLQDKAYQVITSAAQNEEALDVLAGRVVGLRGEAGTHSPFAEALLQALETDVADGVTGRGDGVLSATELYQYLLDTLRTRLDLAQTPGLWTLPQHEKGEYVFIVADRELRLDPAPVLDKDHNPWLGLESYGQEQRRLFFGRDAEIQALATRVAEQPFVAVLGASGAGKSSLVKAGLLPYLQGAANSDREPAGAGWQPAAAASDLAGAGVYHVLPPFRPGNRPVAALAAALREGVGGDLAGQQGGPALPGDDALATLVGRWAAAHPGECLVLTADQCEELVTLASAEERTRFLRLVACAVEQHPEALRVVITLRSDFEPQLAQETPLASLWRREGARYFAPAMSRDSLRQVIEGPAAEAVLFFDPPQMVDELIDEVDRTPGGLPLLSYALSQLYLSYVESHRNDRTLTWQNYVALGGVVGSLRQRATREYDTLPDEAHRRTMGRVMLRMVAVEGGELARRRVALSELEYPTVEENARVKDVLDRLVAARLLVRGTGDASEGAQGEAYVEPAHDALVLAWDKLLRWKKAAEEYLPLQRRLAQAASEWSGAAPEVKAGLLWDDDPRLPQVEQTLWPTDGKQKGLAGRLRWARQVLAPRTKTPADTKWLNRPELSFTEASVSRRARTLRRIIGITATVMVALAGLALFAGYQARQATIGRENAVAERNVRATAEANAVQSEATAVAERDIAQAGRLAAEASNNVDFSNLDVAMLLSLEAISVTNELAGVGPTLQAKRSLLSALQFEPALVGFLELPYTDEPASDSEKFQQDHSFLDKFVPGLTEGMIEVARSNPGLCDDEQYMGEYSTTVQQLKSQGREPDFCFVAPDRDYAVIQTPNEPRGAGGVGFWGTQLRVYGTRTSLEDSVASIASCPASSVPSTWHFQQQGDVLTIWDRLGDAQHPSYSLYFPVPSGTETAIRNVFAVDVSPDRTAIVTLTALGRASAPTVTLTLWDPTMGGRLGDILAVEKYAPSGMNSGDPAMRFFDNERVEFCYNHRQPSPGSGELLDNLELTTLRIGLQGWKEHACQVAGRNLSYDEWLQYFGDAPYHKTCEEYPVHPSVVDTGRELARQGDVGGAVRHFQKIAAWGIALDSPPEEEARRFQLIGQAEQLIDAGRNLVMQGEVDDGMARCREAMDLSGDGEVARKAHQVLLEATWTLIEQTRIQEAAAIYREVGETAAVEINEFAWANLCREGSLQGAADLVAFACERALREWPNSSAVREAAGIWAAQEGDFSEATAHFAWLVKNLPDYTDQPQWRSWLQTLKTGRNPLANGS